MPEGNPPAENARAAEEVERRAERERTEKPAGIPQRRVDRQRRAPSAGLGAAGAASGQLRRVRPDQHRVDQDQGDGAPVRQRRAEADYCRHPGANMVPRMKRRLPNRIANSLPHTLAHTPSSPITLATVAGARAVHAPAALWAAANVRNVTTHARRADISQVWTQ